MRIVFEGVSYSYADLRHQKKRKHSSTRRQKASTAKNDAAHKTYEQAEFSCMPETAWALRDINFALEEGEFLGIAGHTGSGKSTLIQHLNGLLHPTQGRVLIDGENLADRRVATKYRGRVGMVFQYPEHQLFAATVNEDVAFGPRNMGITADKLDTTVRHALEIVHLDPDEIGEKNPFELSGGQQRRVAFAGVLAMEPQVLVLDEPVAGLDPVAREEFLSLIAELHEQGLAVVMVSHCMEDLARLSERILVLNEGKQFMIDTPTKVFARDEELRAIGLDVPAPQKLAQQLRALDFDLPRDLYDVASLADDIAALFTSEAAHV